MGKLRCVNGPAVPRGRVASLDSEMVCFLGALNRCCVCVWGRVCSALGPFPPVPVRATGFFLEKGSLAFLVSHSDRPCFLKAQFCLLASVESLCPNCWPKQVMNKGNDKLPLALHFMPLARHTYQHNPI